MEINKIYEESCLETMKNMPDNFLDLTVTSPPYDNLRNYKDGLKDSWCFDTWSRIIKELYRVTKKGGVVMWNVRDATIKGSKTGTSFKQCLVAKKYGFNIHDIMIWDKPAFTPLSHNRYENSFEFCFIWSKGRPNTFNGLRVPCKTAGKVTKSFSNKEKGSAMRARKEVSVTRPTKLMNNVWSMNTCKERGLDHPARFPIELVNRHIQSWTNEGDLIYDPFMGSGTTAIGAIRNKRNYIGSELSAEYTKIIEDRINKELGNL